MLYLSSQGGSRDTTAESVLAPVLRELLETAGDAGADGAKPQLCLYYDESVARSFEVSQIGTSKEQESIDQTSNVAAGGIAEICDAAVEEAQRLFKRITGEDELFESAQDDEDVNQEE